MASPPSLRPGDLVGVNDGRGARIAVLRGVRGSRLQLALGPEGRDLAAPQREVDLIASLPEAGSAPAPLRIGDPPWGLTPAAIAAAQPSRRTLAEAWLLLSEAAAADEHPRAVPLEDLVSLVADGRDPAQRSACWLWLQGDQLFFRWRQGQLEPRPVEDLRRLRAERHRLALVQRRREQWRQRLQARAPLALDRLAPGERADLQALRGVALGDPDPPLSPELQHLLRDLRVPAEPGPIRHLLADLGQWDRHHLPALEATTWQHGFSRELLEEADRLVAAADQEQPGDGDREDLCGQHVVTIDDPDTRDIDDALALERRPGGAARLWIHIADPGRLVSAGSALDLEARRRGSSLYMARGNEPMFPPQLAHGPMSLRSGLRSAAWSLWVELDAQGAVHDSGLVRSWIRPAYRLSYADADELIELAPPQEADLLEMHALLESRLAWRLARGALQLDDPEGRIRCRQGKAELEVVEPSAARRLVAEAMVLAGAVLAERGRSLGLALPYRSQPAADLPGPAELEQLPPGPVRHAAIKRGLSRGQVGTSPAPHFSLALPAYVQATSPIRRYGDLLVQRQFEALLQSQPPLDADALAALLQEVEPAIRQGIQISRDDQRHWQQVWFEQQERRPLPALFLRWLRPDHQLALVWLEEAALSLACHAPARCQPGERVQVRVQEVDSLRDLLRLEATT